jgi:hypothetical protein
MRATVRKLLEEKVNTPAKRVWLISMVLSLIGGFSFLVVTQFNNSVYYIEDFERDYVCGSIEREFGVGCLIYYKQMDKACREKLRAEFSSSPEKLTEDFFAYNCINPERYSRLPSPLLSYLSFIGSRLLKNWLLIVFLISLPFWSFPLLFGVLPRIGAWIKEGQ